jgi:hypothetical protein
VSTGAKEEGNYLSLLGFTVLPRVLSWRVFYMNHFFFTSQIFLFCRGKPWIEGQEFILYNYYKLMLFQQN